MRKSGGRGWFARWEARHVSHLASKVHANDVVACLDKPRHTKNYANAQWWSCQVFACLARQTIKLEVPVEAVFQCCVYLPSVQATQQKTNLKTHASQSANFRQIILQLTLFHC